MTHDQISRIAYKLWQERGCPNGSPEMDWMHAEEVLLAEEQADEPTVEIPTVEIESVAGLRRVSASEREFPSESTSESIGAESVGAKSMVEVPTLRNEIPPSRSAKSRSRRRADAAL